MKNNPFMRLCVLFVFLFCAFEVSAQMPRGPAVRDMQKNAMKRVMRSSWTGDNSLIIFGMMQQDGFREGIGVSKEQSQKIQDAMMNMGQNLMNDPQFKPLQEEMMKLTTDTQNSPFSENAPPEVQAKFAKLQNEIMDISFRQMSNIVNENITSEQKKKIQEFQISTMSEIPIASPSMFEALDLTDEQKQQLNDIKKKMEPDFEKNLDAMVNQQSDYMEKLHEEIGNKTEGVTDSEEIQRIYQDAGKRVEEKYPEFKKRHTDVIETAKAFANNLKFEMFDVLTDEQMERMGQLIDNPPDFVKKVLGQMRKNRGEKEENTTPGQWQPSLDSWKPGDPIPEEYREHRKKRFPSKAAN